MDENENTAADVPVDDGKIVCQIDNARVHSIQLHIRDNHPDWTIERYKQEFPGAPLFSKKAEATLQQRAAEKQSKMAVAALPGQRQANFHEVFELGTAKAAMSSLGRPIEITVFDNPPPALEPYRAPIDRNYVFNIDLIKKVMVGFQLGMNVYLWGYHGTGKTTVLEQAAARTGRAFMRVQHTINTEESHILGQFVVRDGATVWQDGPLAIAMREGAVYCADEYDFAQPSVTAVYQPVLEGKPLVIKEAPEESRVVRAHPNFRFVATGNTNGVGDETGLYQGTNIQNAANYSRFHITEEVEYMDAKIESSILVSQVGIDKTGADRIVDFAKKVRDHFKNGDISSTVSPRELINAATLGIAFGMDYRLGLKLAFANRLSRVDKQVVDEVAQRIFG